jgi:hypothetical protein
MHQETNQICIKRQHESPTGLGSAAAAAGFGVLAAAALGVSGGRAGHVLGSPTAAWVGVGSGRAGQVLGSPAAAGLGVGGGRWDSQVALERGFGAERAERGRSLQCFIEPNAPGPWRNEASEPYERARLCR